jgi:uncharacterized membrane protein
MSGAAMFGAFVSGLFFLRFWKKSEDRLFLIFGVAFWFMALERLVLIFLAIPANEDHSLVYLIRLLSFLLILYGIADKNRKERNETG